MSPSDPPLDPTATANECRQYFERLREVLGQGLILPARLVEQALIGLVGSGHLLFEGHPGQGKHSLAAAMARLSGLSFTSLSCTPDMTPIEMTGAEELREDPETQRRRYQFVSGPLFANVAYLGDIHQAPSKCLAMLVDSMRRRQVGHGQSARDLPTPFSLVATAPPASEDSEWMLAESVTDWFLLKLAFKYPGEQDEWEIGRQARVAHDWTTEPLVSPERLLAFQRAAVNLEMPDNVLGYAWALARATRPGNELAPDFVETWLRLGISPQGLIALISAAKARALLRGRTSCTRRDVYEVAPPVFEHRLRCNDEARAAGLTIDRLIGMLLERISMDEEYRPEPDL